MWRTDFYLEPVEKEIFGDALDPNIRVFSAEIKGNSKNDTHSSMM